MVCAILTNYYVLNLEFVWYAYNPFLGVLFLIPLGNEMVINLRISRDLTYRGFVKILLQSPEACNVVGRTQLPGALRKRIGKRDN